MDPYHPFLPPPPPPLPQSSIPAFHLSRLPLPPHPATINEHDLPRNIPAGLTRKEDNRTFEIIWCSPSSRGNAFQDALRPCLVLRQRLDQFRSDVAGSNGVDSDSFSSPLVGERLGELRNPALGCRVRWDQDTTLKGHQGRHVDDASSPARAAWRLLKHVRADVTTKGKNAAKVDLKNLESVSVDRSDAIRLHEIGCLPGSNRRLRTHDKDVDAGCQRS